jgi:hypothetical protein
MTKVLLHPPETTTSFRFAAGCGEAHEYDGEHGIDCERCIEHVATLSPDERIGHPALRGPVVLAGDNPAEIAANQRAWEAKRAAASYRLMEAQDESAEAAPAISEDAAAELERLRQENEELRGRLTRKRTTA